MVVVEIVIIPHRQLVKKRIRTLERVKLMAPMTTAMTVTIATAMPMTMAMTMTK